MYGSLDIAVSGMIAQRTRLEVVAANIANQDAILDGKGQVNPYRRREVFFAPGDPSAGTARGRALGVHVSAVTLDQAPLGVGAYDPGSPYAYTSGVNKGHLAKTNVNPVIEQINAMEAGRAYEANVMAAETTKSMMAQGLRLLA
jgi:flagellar basal-body rod protein FlgC